MRVEDLSTDLNKIRDIFAKYGISDVSVFGSFSRGDATDTSDVDLLVTYSPGTTLFDITRLNAELEEEFGRKVDLISQRSLSERLAKRITHETRPLFVAS